MPQRTPLVVGNWKMNTDRAGAVALALGVDAGARGLAGVEVGVCPPLVYADAVIRALRDAGSTVIPGVQNVYHEANGAFTGEVSVPMLKDLGVQAVICGHSERRHILGESDELVGKKVAAVLSAGLRCILCVGETLDQRGRGETNAVNERQLRAGLSGVTAVQAERLIVAYEPVWAIGTGRNATPGDAQSAHIAVRAVLGSIFGDRVAGATRILYGGSMKPDNARALIDQPDIDGGLIGGASLSAQPFLDIARAAVGSR